MPRKIEELWTVLALPGAPGEVRGDLAQPRFGDPALGGRKLGEARILFPRIELEKQAAG